MQLKPVHFLFTYFILTFSASARAQNVGPSTGPLYVGLIGGANYSNISKVDKIIISEPYFINYNLKNEYVYGEEGGVFFDYKLDADHWSLNGEVVYSAQGTTLSFSNSQDFNYTMKFNYQFVNIQPKIDYYILTSSSTTNYTSFHVGLGLKFGYNTAPYNIVYTSSGTGKLPAFGTDLEQQQQLRNVLYGENNLGFVVATGFQFSSFEIELRAFRGLKNIVEVQPNSYNFIQQDNHNNTFEGVLKYYINLK